MQDSPRSNLARPSSHLVALHPAFRLVQSYPLLWAKAWSAPARQGAVGFRRRL